MTKRRRKRGAVCAQAQYECHWPRNQLHSVFMEKCLIPVAHDLEQPNRQVIIAIEGRPRAKYVKVLENPTRGITVKGLFQQVCH